MSDLPVNVNLSLLCQRFGEIKDSISTLRRYSDEATPQTPYDYAGCFTTLASNGVISEALSERLNDLASFRYMLEHVYDQVDDSQLWEILRCDLGDMEEYLDAVYGAVQARSS